MRQTTQHERVQKLVDATNQKPDDMSWTEAYKHFSKLYFPLQNFTFKDEVTEDNLLDYIMTVTE